MAILLLAAPAALALIACAESADSASGRDEGSVSVPGAAEAGADALDGSDAGDAALPDVPCAVGNVCRVQTPLTTGTISAISGRSRSDVWAAGSLGLMMRWDGQVWTKLGSPETVRDLTTLTSLVLDADETWGVAGTKLLRRGTDPGSVRWLDLFITWDELRRVPTSVVALADGSRYVGCAPGSTISGDITGALYDVTSFDRTKMPVMAEPVIAGTGQRWPIRIRAMTYAPGKALWTVGDRGGVARYPLEARDAGERWALGGGIVFPIAVQRDLLAAWADGDHLWAAGDGGAIVHFDGASWHIQDSGTTAALRAIFGFAETDIWAAGDDGTLLHFDGTSWSQIPVQGYSGSLRAIWGGAPDDLWIGGEDGMFHWGALP